MNTIIRNFAVFLDNRNVRYDIGGDGQNIMQIYQSLKENPSVQMRILLAGNEEVENPNDISLRLYGLGSVQNPSPNFLKKLNELNLNYKWFKFVVSNEGEIYMGLDASVEGNVNQQIIDYIFLGLGIADNAYPHIMKSIWA